MGFCSVLKIASETPSFRTMFCICFDAGCEIKYSLNFLSYAKNTGQVHVSLPSVVDSARNLVDSMQSLKCLCQSKSLIIDKLNKALFRPTFKNKRSLTYFYLLLFKIIFRQICLAQN